jgi:hypothetical protein
MAQVQTPAIDVSPELLEAVESFPTAREVTHCGSAFSVSPLDIYATCPTCGTRLKVRAFSAGPDLEDLFDAFLTWLNDPAAARIAAQRQREIADD